MKNLISKIKIKKYAFAILICLSLFTFKTTAQGSWIQKSDFGGTGRDAAVGFSVGTKAYIGTGWDENYIPKKDFWEYNSLTNAWTQKADFGGGVRSNAVGFSIGNKGYIGTGYDCCNTETKDFWEYNPSNNTWTKKADFGGGERTYATGFSIGSKGYIGTGERYTALPPRVIFKDFWEYDTTANTWTKKADFGGTERKWATGFSIGNKGYLGTGYDTTHVNVKDFWEYNPSNNIWTKKADYAGGIRTYATGFSVGGKGYLGTGNNGSTFYTDFWEYDAIGNSWTPKTDYRNSGAGILGAKGFAIGSKGYIGTGKEGSSVKDFWQFNPWSYGFTASSDSVCVGTVVTFTNTTTDPDAKYYTWIFYTPNYNDTITKYDTLSTIISHPYNISGTHIVQMYVRDSNNVQVGSYSMSIYVSKFDTLNISSKPDTCTGNVGIATANPLGAVLPYSYSWSNNNTTPTISSLSPGVYTLTVTDKLGCSKKETVSIGTKLNAYNLSITSMPDTCTGNVGSIKAIPLTVFGVAAPPYSYSWSNGGSTQTITGLSPGTYSVTLTDRLGCSTTRTNIQVSTHISTISPALTSKPDTCTGNTGLVISNASGGTHPYMYSWSNSKTTQAITGLTPGTYSLSITDKNGCSATASVAVTVFTGTISTSFISGNPSCNTNNGSLTASPSGGAAPYTYTWSNGGSMQTISGLASGSYSVTVNDKNGCSGANSFSLLSSTVLPVPAICMVTVDSLSQNNMVIWDKSAYQHIDSFIVYREVGTNNYQPIGSVHYNSRSVFKDTIRAKYFPNTGNPNAGTYRYKLQLLDSCGNRSQLSPYHNTIFIINNNGSFSWPQLYTIEGSNNPVNAYVLMRDDNSTGNWNAINSVAGTQQTVTDPAYSNFQNTASWRIETLWNITCNPTIKKPVINAYNSSLSNIYSKTVISVPSYKDDFFIDIYPNPFKTEATIAVSGKPNVSDWEIKIYDLTGRMVKTIRPDAPIIKIERRDLSDGMYFLEINDGQNILAKKKIVIGTK